MIEILKSTTMKKMLSIIVLVSSSIICMAQQGLGTPFNFCSLNGVQYNPGWHPQESNPNNSDMWVVTREDEDLSECERIYYEISFREDYPGHTILGPARVQ